ncbi:MAG: hypothetical protein ABL963_04945 [Longimicrobiales bacterium]
MIQYSMVEECTNRYEATRAPDGRLHIAIDVPCRFAELWLDKLDALRTTDDEIAAFETPDAQATK